MTNWRRIKEERLMELVLSMNGYACNGPLKENISNLSDIEIDRKLDQLRESYKIVDELMYDEQTRKISIR